MAISFHFLPSWSSKTVHFAILGRGNKTEKEIDGISIDNLEVLENLKRRQRQSYLKVLSVLLFYLYLQRMWLNNALFAVCTYLPYLLIFNSMNKKRFLFYQMWF